MSTTTLYLVRHGEADADVSNDAGLTLAGVGQAAAAGQALRDANVDVVLHSSRRRATETARAIAAALGGVPTQHSGSFEDRTPVPGDWDAVPIRYHSVLRNVPENEADHGAHQLTAAFEQFSETQQQDRVIVAVTHNFVIGWFVRSALDAPWWRWIGLNQANGGITAIRWSHGREPTLLSFNERSHLPNS